MGWACYVVEWVWVSRDHIGTILNRDITDYGILAVDGKVNIQDDAGKVVRT